MNTEIPDFSMKSSNQKPKCPVLAFCPGGHWKVFAGWLAEFSVGSFCKLSMDCPGQSL
jgi:hypothetical protein